MKLYHLYPKANIKGQSPWEPWYDKVFGFVIRANNEEEARELANENGGCETGDPWLDPNYSECIELKEEGEVEVVIIDLARA